MRNGMIQSPEHGQKTPDQNRDETVIRTCEDVT